MNILSIQSHVAYGHVGNSAAVFALQRLGAEVWPIHTVQFSNHTGYGLHKAEAFARSDPRRVRGSRRSTCWPNATAFYPATSGGAAIGAAILDMVARVQRRQSGRALLLRSGDRRHHAWHLCPADLAAFVKERLVAAADLVTPNQFELDFIAGRTTATLADARDAVKLIHASGPRVVLVTSLRTEETPDDALDVIVSDQNGQFRLRTPLLPLKANGAGDLMAALFFLHHFRTDSAAQAMALAASSLYGILDDTAEAGSSEMLLIEAQDQLIKPSQKFRPEPL